MGKKIGIIDNVKIFSKKEDILYLLMNKVRLNISSDLIIDKIAWKEEELLKFISKNKLYPNKKIKELLIR